MTFYSPVEMGQVTSCLLWLSGGLVVTLAYVKSRRHRGLPPGPRCLPFVGNLNLVFKSVHFHQTLEELAKTYGRVFSKHTSSALPPVVLKHQQGLNSCLRSPDGLPTGCRHHGL